MVDLDYGDPTYAELIREVEDLRDLVKWRTFDANQFARAIHEKFPTYSLKKGVSGIEMVCPWCGRSFPADSDDSKAIEHGQRCTYAIACKYINAHG